MAIAIRGKQALSRRHLLVRSASTLALAGLGNLARPYLSWAADRPQIVGGIQSGDVTGGSAVVWARATGRAHANGVLDGRELCHHSRRRIVRRAAGSRLHLEGPA